jgi:DNA-binding NtrC family response regulator
MGEICAATNEPGGATREQAASGVFRTGALRSTERGLVVGRSEGLRAVLATVDRVARSSCTVLISGESGTGKEAIAAAVHEASPRAAKPFVAVNCAAIPDSLLESELFGHVKGAFTGAHAARQGRVAAAEGGTLFLDEVGELPLSLQVKLLRLLQQREYSPLGEGRTLRCDIRIVAATNRDLARDVAAGTFRQDLYYRLNVIHVRLPPLRERPGDVRPLAEHFFRLSAARSGRLDLRGLSDEALACLEANPWPGNVRDLENAIEHAVLLAEGPLVGPADLPERLRPAAAGAAAAGAPLPEGGLDLRAAVEAFENGLVLQALERTGWNKNRAARLLGLNRTTLVEMLKRKGLRGPER